MTRKIEQLAIDGVKVDLSKARFADTFEVPEGDERFLPFDAEGVAVVLFRVAPPSFRESKGGEISRVNVLKVKECRLAHNADVAANILEKLRFDQRPVRSLFDEDDEPEQPDREPAVAAPLTEPATLEPVEVPPKKDYETVTDQISDQVTFTNGDGEEVPEDQIFLTQPDPSKDEENFFAASKKLVEQFSDEEGFDPVDTSFIEDEDKRRIESAADHDDVLKRFLSGV